MILTAILLFVTVLLRLLTITKAATFDTYGHLYACQQVENGKTGPLKPIKTKMVGSKDFPYPVLYHWMLVKIFGFKNFLNWHWCLNPIIDLLFTGLMGFIFYSLFGLEIALKSSLLYLLIPLCFTLISSGPRLRSWSPRLFTEVTVGLYFIMPYLSNFLHVPSAYWICFALMTILAIIVLGSSKFGLQALIFIGVPASLFSWSTIFILPGLAAFLLLIILTKGDFYKTVLRQYSHLKLYYQRNESGKAAVRDRSNVVKSMKFPEGTSFFKRINLFIFNRPSENGILAMLLRFPSYLIVTAGIILFWKEGHASELFLLSAPILAGFLAFLIISIPSFLFLGEAERYPIHVAILSSLALVLMANEASYGNWMYQGLVVYGFLYMLWDYKDRLLKRNQNTEKFPESSIEYLNQSKEPLVLLCYPYHVGPLLRFLVETPHLGIATIFCDTETEEFIKKDYEEAYGYLKLDRLDKLYQDFGVNTVILREQHFNLLDKSWELRHQEEGKGIFYRIP